MAFDEDPFEDIFSTFFGRPSPTARKSRPRPRDSDDQSVSVIEDEEYVYLIVELPGYTEKDISLDVSGHTLLITTRARTVATTQEYFKQKLAEGITLERELPDTVRPKKFSHTFINGVLEVTFAHI